MLATTAMRIAVTASFFAFFGAIASSWLGGAPLRRTLTRPDREGGRVYTDPDRSPKCVDTAPPAVIQP
jgi:hypothetical protein